jgi:dihydroflavonol-4-reductase
MATVVVTGATGFLGRHTVRALRERGHAVRAMARNPPRDAQAQLGEGVTIVRADVLDPAGLTTALEGADAVFHLAGMVSRRPEDAEALYRAHVLGTRAVLAAARAAGVRKLIHASTSGTVGISDDERVATEADDAPVRWLSRFGYYRAKWIAEKEALAASGPDFEVISVNPSLLLGPGDAFGSSTDDVRRFLDRSIPAAPRGGLAFVDARDAAEALVLAFERGRGGERYLINAANMTVRDFFGRLERISGVQGPSIALPRSRMAALAGNALFSRAVKAIGGEPPVDAASVEMGQLFWYVSSAKAERELRWSARDPNETLADTVRDLRGA